MRTRDLLLSGALCGAALSIAPDAEAQRRPPVMLRSGNKCLDVHGSKVQTNGARVQLWDCHGGPNQLWRFDRDGRIINVASGRCLDLNGPDVGIPGGRVQVWDCNGSPNQSWRMEGARLVVAADNRCLDVHRPDVNRNGAHVETDDCRGGPGQAWVLEGGAAVPPPPPMVPPPPPPMQAREVEAGPLWNQRDAEGKCPRVCAPGAWNGQWRTTVPNRMSVCACTPGGPPVMVPPPPPAPGPAGPGWQHPRHARPVDDARFGALIQAMNAESFSQGKIRVIEAAVRSDFFLVSQLRTVIEALTFSNDKIRAVELIGPRLLDRNNIFTLYSVFTFEGDKERARQILEPR